MSQQQSIPAERLRIYLPEELADALLDDSASQSTRLVEAFVHLAAARYTITTYLPQVLVRRLLAERSESPWLHWIDGSLLFADLSGSTALAERLSTLGREGIELVTDFLNHIFVSMIQVVQEYGGDLVAFGGDALLVFFDDERHTRAAARAALALQAALRGYVRTVPGVGSFPMHLHVGIESGPVAFAGAGQPGALHLCVLGSTVNRVAVAEGHAGAGEVVAGPRAWPALKKFAGDGTEVAPDFVRFAAMRPAAAPHVPLADDAPIDAAPEQAIQQLLDDLDQLRAYIPRVLLARILADPQRPQIEADLRPVTVLFAQVVGLEALAEMLPPTLAARAIQIYIGAMQEAIERYGGVVNKLDVADAGVKLVAIFGAPAAYEDHAERATRAGLEMQQRLPVVVEEIHELSRKREAASAVVVKPNDDFAASPLRQRIGLNVGTAFAGNVGSAVRKEYTVMGDAVNVAARVMSNASWGEVWCGEAAAAAIGGRVVCAPRGTVLLKGKAAPMALYQALSPRDAPASGVFDDGPLVGRGAELRELQAHLVAVIAGQGRTLRIAGEAGVGKSRIAAELVREARARGARIITTACFSYTAGIPYAAWGEWLKALCGIVSGDGDEARAAKLAAKLAELGAGMEEWLPLLGDLVRLDVPDNRLTRGLDPKLRQDRRFALLQGLLLQAAATQPVVVVFEDLHWADPISLDLWREVAQAIADLPILLLGVHRPTALDDQAHVLALRELSDEQSMQMITTLAGEQGLPETITRQIAARASGNPLFLAELLRAVTEQPQQLALDQLPESLNGLLLSRIDRLDESSRGVLRVASVIGQRIPFGVLQSLGTADQQQLLRQLTRLDSEQMTQLEREAPERVHTFRHALIQEVAYQSMLFARRRELHGRIGAYLEQRYAEDLDDYYGLLAHHYRLSDRRDKAVDYLLRAGHAARDVYANDEAEQYYRWALDALQGDGDARAWEVRDALADVYATIGRYDDALAQLAAVIDAPAVTPDAAQRAHRKRGGALEKQSQYVAALDELDRAMTIARSGVAGISRLAVPLINADLALVYQRRGEYDQAIAACEEGLRHLWPDERNRDDDLTEARLHSTLGTIYGMRGDYPRAQHHFARSLAAREAVDDLPGMVISHNNLGYLWQLQGEYSRAIDHYRLAEELAKKINLRYMVIFADLNMAWALISLGSYAEAEERGQDALHISREMNDRRNVAQSYDILGLVAYHRGDYTAALAWYRQGLDIHRALGSAPQEGSTLANMAVTLNAAGKVDEAANAAREVLDRAQALDAQRLKVEALNALAEALLGRDDRRASEYAREAVALSETIGSKVDAGIAHRLLGCAVAAGGGQFAYDFEESITLLEQINERFELGRTWAAYGAALLEHGNQIGGIAYLKQAHVAFMAIGADGELRRLVPLLERST